MLKRIEILSNLYGGLHLICFHISILMHSKNWISVNTSVIKIWIGLDVLVGYHKLSSYKNYCPLDVNFRGPIACAEIEIFFWHENLSEKWSCWLQWKLRIERGQNAVFELCFRSLKRKKKIKLLPVTFFLPYINPHLCAIHINCHS